MQHSLPTQLVALPLLSSFYESCYSKAQKDVYGVRDKMAPGPARGWQHMVLAAPPQLKESEGAAARGTAGGTSRDNIPCAWREEAEQGSVTPVEGVERMHEGAGRHEPAHLLVAAM